jgi:toxin ParE1/3/4
MNRYRVTEDARNDLNEIWLYIAEDNEIAANRFIRALVARFPMLASRPEMGRERKELPGKLRSHAFGNYIIFYRRTQSGIEIARVLHGARDLPPLFE